MRGSVRAVGIAVGVCCALVLQLAISRRDARTTVEVPMHAGYRQQLMVSRLVQLAQAGAPRPAQNAQAAAAAAAALKREVEMRGGAHSPAMGVIRHVTRGLAGRTASLPLDSGCDCALENQQELRAVEQSLCDCAPPRLVNGEDCGDIAAGSEGKTNGVRWLIDCESQWVAPPSPAPPPAIKPREEEEYTVQPVGAQQYADALEVPPGEEHPEIERDEMGPTPDIFAPQEPWHKLKDYRNEWVYDYEAAPYTAVYDDESEHDQFSPEEPWNDRPDDIILDASLADLKAACLRAGADHEWDSAHHQCIYQGQPNYAEMPRGRGVTQEGPSRLAMDGRTPVGDVYDDAKELDEFGARRPEPAGEVDQFGWRPAPPERLRDTMLDYQTVDLERECRSQMQVPGKGMAYTWDPLQGRCLYLGKPARAEEQPAKTTHPLTDGIYGDMKRDCLNRGGEWLYPRVDGGPGTCEDVEDARR